MDATKRAATIALVPIALLSLVMDEGVRSRGETGRVVIVPRR